MTAQVISINGRHDLMKRVVVTGMSGITSLGESADQVFEQFAQGRSGIALYARLGNVYRFTE